MGLRGGTCSYQARSSGEEFIQARGLGEGFRRGVQARGSAEGFAVSACDGPRVGADDLAHGGDDAVDGSEQGLRGQRRGEC